MTISRIFPVAALAAAIVAASPASADTYSFGTIAPGATMVTPPFIHGVGSFTDTVTFSLTAGGDGSVAYADLVFLSFYDIGPVNLVLVNDAAPAVSLFDGLLTSNTPQTVSFTSGSYTATLTGTASGTAGGVYAFSVSAPAVPEPAAWGTMLLGLGLAGSLARRRRHTLAAA